MSRATPTKAVQKQFFDRLTTDERSIAQILKDLGVSSLEFARWQQSLPFRILLSRCLRSNRRMARLEIFRAIPAKRVAEKSAASSVEKEHTQQVDAIKTANDVEPERLRVPEDDRKAGEGGEVPHILEEELSRALREIKSDAKV